MFCQGITEYAQIKLSVRKKASYQIFYFSILPCSDVDTLLNSQILAGGGELRPQEAGPAAGGPGALTGADQGAAGGSRGQGADRALTGADHLADTDTGQGGTSQVASLQKRRQGRVKSRSGNMDRASCSPASAWCLACSASTDS